MRALGFKISKESIEDMIGKQVCYLMIHLLIIWKASEAVTKCLLLTEFKLGTVSYRPGFSTQIYCPSEKHVSSKSYIPERSLPEIMLSVEVTCLIDNNCYNHFFFVFVFILNSWLGYWQIWVSFLLLGLACKAALSVSFLAKEEKHELN